MFIIDFDDLLFNFIDFKQAIGLKLYFSAVSMVSDFVNCLDDTEVVAGNVRTFFLEFMVVSSLLDAFLRRFLRRYEKYVLFGLISYHDNWDV